jgi:CBS domain-containing protein
MTVSSELDREPPRGLSERSVRATMLRVPKVLPSGARVADASELFEDDHVHAALVVDESGRLCSVVLREDLLDRDPEDDAAAVGRLEERTIPVDAGLEAAWRAMCELGQRRRAVVDPESGRLVGLLCLKRSGSGFCTDADAAARAADRGSQTQG